VGGFGEGPHTDIDMPWLAEMPMPPRAPTGPSPLGAGYLILVSRELSGLPQATLARRVRTSQPAIARLETGNALPTIRTLLRIVEAPASTSSSGSADPTRRPRSRRPAGSGVRAPRDAASQPRRRPGRLHGPARALPPRGATLRCSCRASSPSRRRA